jgi:hypothetical protein
MTEFDKLRALLDMPRPQARTMSTSPKLALYRPANDIAAARPEPFGSGAGDNGSD